MREGITVIVPTTGRPSLSATLLSFAGDLCATDAVIVMTDGKQEGASWLVQQYANLYPGPDWACIRASTHGNWGHPLRNEAIERYVETTHVWTIDDDDIAEEGAFRAMREHMGDPWALFRMTFGPGHFANGITCWRFAKPTMGDIGTPMMFAPVCGARFGDCYTGDWDYFKALSSELGDPVMCEEVVAIIRPEATDDLVPAA